MLFSILASASLDGQCNIHWERQRQRDMERERKRWFHIMQVFTSIQQCPFMFIFIHYDASIHNWRQ